MWMMHRNKGKAAKTVCVSVAILVAAHIAAGILLCKGMPKRSPFGRMVKKVKRTASGLVREWF